MNRRGSCCCDECQEEYEKQVIEARSNRQPVDLLSDRIDMTKDQVAELMRTPYEEVKKQTIDELADYQESIEIIGLAATTDKINEEIDVDTDSVEIESQSEQADEPVNTNRRTRKSKYNS